MRNPTTFLAGKKNLLIITHKNADLDALASAIIVSEAYPGKILCPEGPSKAAAEAAEKLGVPVFENPPSEEFDGTVIVDTSDLSQIEPFEIGALPRPIVLFDHHLPKGGLETIDSLAIAEKPSCVEVVLNYIGPVSRRARVAAVMGIYADTRHLGIAPLETLRKVIELSIEGELFDEGRELAQFRPEFSQRVAVVKALSGLRYEKLPDETIIAWATAGSFESNVANSLVSAGADIALVATRKRAETRISARASGKMRDRIHLGQVFQKLGGGGHPGAALVNLPPEKDEASALESAVSLIKEILGSPK
jgi:nanoRNase/pAp phosphatase (c-di-AMP/oligoRNAs hydrolase)